MALDNIFTMELLDDISIAWDGTSKDEALDNTLEAMSDGCEKFFAAIPHGLKHVVQYLVSTDAVPGNAQVFQWLHFGDVVQRHEVMICLAHRQLQGYVAHR